MSVFGSIRLSVPSLLLVTHTEPSPTATPVGPLPTRTVPTTLLTAGLIRETVPLRLFATHTAPAPTAIAPGPEPTGMLCTACDRGSIRETVLSLVVAHTAPSPPASDVGEDPTGAWPAIEPPDGLITPTESTASTDRGCPPPVDVITKTTAA